MYFRSAFVGTVVILEMSQGSITIKSDNPSAITIIKDQLTTDASNKKIPIEFESKINMDSVAHTLELLQPLI